MANYPHSSLIENILIIHLPLSFRTSISGESIHSFFPPLQNPLIELQIPPPSSAFGFSSTVSIRTTSMCLSLSPNLSLLLSFTRSLISLSSASLASNSANHFSFLSAALRSFSTLSNSFLFSRSLLQYADPATIAAIVKNCAYMRRRNMMLARWWSFRRIAYIMRQPLSISLFDRPRASSCCISRPNQCLWGRRTYACGSD